MGAGTLFRRGRAVALRGERLPVEMELALLRVSVAGFVYPGAGRSQGSTLPISKPGKFYGPAGPWLCSSSYGD